MPVQCAALVSSKKDSKIGLRVPIVFKKLPQRPLHCVLKFFDPTSIFIVGPLQMVHARVGICLEDKETRAKSEPSAPQVRDSFY